MQISLIGKRALVCGSSQGIGKASALALAKAGAHITLLSRNEYQLNEVKSELDLVSSGEHHVIVADFFYPEKVQAAIAKYLSEGFEIDILVNNTGGPPSGPIIEAGLDAFRKAFEQHLINNHLLTLACLPGMQRKKNGRIINIISTSVKQPLPNLGVSNTIRAAVGNWAKTMANELGPYGITVNNVLPGATSTSRLKSLIEQKSFNTGETKEKIEQEMIAEIPARRFASPDEVAAAVVFLASEQASYINGVNLPVDGGRTSCL